MIRLVASSPGAAHRLRTRLSESGLIAPLHAALEPLAKRSHAAFFYGSIAKSTEQAASDVDLLVITDKLDYADVYAALQTAEAALGRSANPNVMTLAEWRRKRGQAGFDLFHETPSSGNAKAKVRYAANRFSVARQFRHSRDETQRALDLAVFINGLPVATFDLNKRLIRRR